MKLASQYTTKVMTCRSHSSASFLKQLHRGDDVSHLTNPTDENLQCSQQCLPLKTSFLQASLYIYLCIHVQFFNYMYFY